MGAALIVAVVFFLVIHAALALLVVVLALPALQFLSSLWRNRTNR